MGTPTKRAQTSILLASVLFGTIQAANLDTPSQKAFRYLASESLQWARDNKCYSCHNNGDAARALFLTASDSNEFSNPQWNELFSWYRKPEGWIDATNSDLDLSPTLGLVQFGAASRSALRHAPSFSRATDASRLQSRILAAQHEDGFWRVESEGQIGSPGTYGNVLGTLMALEILAYEPTPQVQTAITRSIDWVYAQSPQATIELAAGAQILKRSPAPEKQSKSNRWLRTLVDQQNSDGGWGPYRSQFSEVFDTAIALIALSAQTTPKIGGPAIHRGRSFLFKTQESYGGWPETTRPTGGTSYAQHISTSAWALIAINAIADQPPQTDTIRNAP